MFEFCWKGQRRQDKCRAGGKRYLERPASSNADDTGARYFPVKGFACPHCDKCFSHKGYLKKHINKMHTEVVADAEETPRPCFVIT